MKIIRISALVIWVLVTISNFAAIGITEAYKMDTEKQNRIILPAFFGFLLWTFITAMVYLFAW